MRQRIRKGILNFSVLLFPILFMFLSPYIIIVAATNGMINGSAIVFGIFLITSIVSSRLFCGWLCPGGAIQDMAAVTNFKPWNGRIKNLMKYIIWAIWLSFVIYLWVRHAPLKTDFLYMFGMDIHMTIIYFIVTSIIFFLSIATGKRGMCHSYCWMAPFMVIGEKIADALHIPRFRLKADSKACIACGQCNKKCPMSLDIQGMVKSGNPESSECISCLECVDICPKKAICCGLSNKKVK